MNQVFLSGNVVSLEYVKISDEYYETRLFLTVDNFDKTNPQTIPIKFINKLAHLAYVNINEKQFLYVSGELIFYRDTRDNKYKTYVLANYFEDKSNPLKLWSKEDIEKMFINEWTPEELSKQIKLATSKLNQITKMNSIKEKAFKKALKKKNIKES